MEGIIYWVLTFCCAPLVAGALDWRVQRLNQFQQKYNASMADIIFMVDVSGSVSGSGFNIEKEFVTSLLSKISVQRDATRVAVVTFGVGVSKNIDYIDYKYNDKDKCTFTEEFAQVVHRYEGATNINDALKMSRSILDGAEQHRVLRGNVNTVAFLLTDGGWNRGGSPYGTAQGLRVGKHFVELFVVGIGRWLNRGQLDRIAGNRNNVIMADDFSDFSKLATRIRGDQVERLYRRIPDHTKCKQCDINAMCSCGTISGIYTCSCYEGYYGSGTVGRCTKCPRGTYKEYPSPDPCKKCPQFSTSHQVGSTSPHDCKCLPGYTGYPHTGNPCDPKKCSYINPVLKNGVIPDCGKYYKDTCTFVCNKNFHIANEVVTSTSRKLTCGADGIWDNAVPQCVPITCQSFQTPAHMKVKCEGNHLGHKCTFECKEGYILIGAKERTCQGDGQWSGNSQPFCKVITCPKLRPIENVNVYPVQCLSRATDYNNGCAFACKSGFKFKSGDLKRTCTSKGTWSGQELVCTDQTPPTITCPKDITADANFNQAFLNITFNYPTVRDNSITGSDDITVTQTPSYVISPYEFPIGVTIVEYNASDAVGNSHSCRFRVTVLDREKPLFTYCPENIATEIDNKNDVMKTVFWEAPQYNDNSGEAQIIRASNSNPSNFSVGTVNEVVYEIKDASNNYASCKFLVKVDSKQCPEREPPVNGALSTRNSAIGKIYAVFCQNPYTFNGPSARAYICDPNGKWFTIPSMPTTFWPNCTEIQPQEGMGQRMKFFYYTGSCQQDEGVRALIAQKFVTLLDRVILRFEGGCASPDNRNLCQPENVIVRCGKTSNAFGAQDSVEIELDVNVHSKEDISKQTSRVQSVSQAIHSDSAAKSLQVITVGSSQLVFGRVENVGAITGVCLDGSVFDSVKVSRSSEKVGCVSCVAGRYFKTSTRNCTDCPRGTYSLRPGSLGCTACPAGTTTATAGVSNSTKCREPCKAGTRSKDGLAPCQECPVGYYQPSPFQSKCEKCPGQTTTLQGASKKLDSCKMLCPAGTYSSTGMEPCTPCDIGFYQSNKGQKQCTKCPEPLSTHSIGTAIQLMCKKISHCASTPCVNGGKCTDEWNSFKCSCPAGFSGDRCQEQRDECQNNPCYGDAVCVDGVNSFACVCPENFYGEFCSERKVQCKANTCASNQATGCYETEDGPRCKCKPGFTGNYCEQSINECASSPCKNGAVCVDGHRGFECQCVHGYNGTLCQQNVDDCVNGACLNGGSCVDGLNSYTCQCPPGYAGHRCEVNVNECTANPCRNGATCVDKINGYQCKCLPSFYGQHCTQRKTANDFELVFDRKVQGYAEGNILSALEEFTIAFWLKVDKNEKDSGTILSYAIEQGDRVIDNALVIGDINNFMLNVMGEEVETGVSVADGVWHHVAITWSGKTGAFNSYKDGVNVVSQTGFQKGVAIPGNGIFVLGQEQDEVGRNFSASEAFDGSMSQLNMWNYVKDGAEILRMSSFRCDQQLGNVLGWTDFNQVSVAVKQTNTFCSVKNTKFTAWSNVARPSCNAASAQCMSGKHMGIKELNLFKATCTAAGYHCSNSEQTQHDSTNTNRCPTDMKIRYECPFTPRTDCDASKCNNRGKCIDTSDSFICQCNDGFSGSRCQTELKCASVEPFVNGYSREVNNQVIFSCKSGYQLVGASTVTCVQGRYNKPIPTCVDINECNVNNGNCNQLCVNTKGSFRCACANGYKMHAGVCVDTNECNRKNSCQQKCVNTRGSYKCSCSKGYTLSADRVSCQDLSECQMKQHNCQQLCSNKLSSFECLCRPGYKLTQDGITCQKVSCPGLSAPANGGVSRGFGYFGMQATFTCNSGYRLQGDVKTTCRADGKWSGLKPVCVEVQCASLPSPHNGMSTVHGSGLNSRYTFTCFSGHRLVGSSVLMCQMDGTWSGKQPTCVSSRCTPLRNPSNGVIVGSSTQLGATVIIKCDQGYMLNNKLEGYRTCQSDGLWSHGNTQCVKLSCGRPASLANGTVIGQSFGINDIITYRCNPGFGLSGPPMRKCLSNEEWSGVAPKCLYHSCGYPGSLKNGELVGSDYTFGSSVSYKCKANYRLVGSTSRTCQTTGAWSNALPKCQEIKCVAPAAPTNGEVQGSKFTVNSHVLFDCRPGYTLLGERLITCQSNGKWSVPFPTCAVGKCGSAKLVGPSGTITSPNFPNSYNTTEYCRWNIVMPVNQQAYVDVKTLKTVAPDDTLEIYDGLSKSLLTVLGGSLPRSIRVTSSSNELDVRFISSGKHTAAGFTANYGSTTCGGHITALGGTLSTPNYPSNYPDNVHCTWIINIPGERIKLNFENFDTEEYDELEIWSSLSVLSSGKKLGAWSGFRGSFIDVVSSEMMFVSFTSNDKYARRGFRATVQRKTGVTL